MEDSSCRESTVCDIELAQGNALCYKRWLGSVDWSINELLKTI